MNITRQQPLYKHPLGLGIVGLIVIVGVVAMLELTNTTHLFHTGAKSQTAASAGQTTKGETSATSNQKTTATATPAPTATTPAPTNVSQPVESKHTGGASSSTLIAPSGNFVSAHKNISLSTTLSSVCNTTVSATCKIEFTLNGVSKSLESEATDSGGSVFWSSWTPGSIGLTPGSWQVTAVANLNGKTATTTDTMNLEIKS